MVTGANKGIGLETVRQLVKSGVMVVLTARDEKRGMEAVASLQKLGLFNVCFHQLDVQSPESIASLAEFMENQFGRLDILVRYILCLPFYFFSFLFSFDFFPFCS